MQHVFTWKLALQAVFWGTQLLLAMLEFTVASNAAIWYLNEEKPPGWPLKTSIFRIFRYHFGSLAFGSMIVAIIQLIRVILEFVEHQAKKTEMGDTAACLRKWIFNCIRCLLYCLEKCVKFINKNVSLPYLHHERHRTSSPPFWPGLHSDSNLGNFFLYIMLERVWITSEAHCIDFCRQWRSVSHSLHHQTR